MANQRGRGNDALGSLLNDFSVGMGMDKAFAKPSLSDMKAKGGATPMSSMKKQPSQRTLEPPKPLNQQTSKPSDVSGDDLEAMFGKLSTATQPVTTTFTPRPSSTTTPATAPPSSVSDPFLGLGGFDAAPAAAPASTSAVDPLGDIFGMGDIAGSSTSAAIPSVTAPTAGHDDDVFGVFSLPKQNNQQAQAANGTSSASVISRNDSFRQDSGNNTSDFDSIPPQQQHQQASSSPDSFHDTIAFAAPPTRPSEPAPPSSTSFTEDHSPQQQQQQEQQGQTSSFAARLAAQEQTQPRRHKAFDYLEPIDDDNNSHNASASHDRNDGLRPTGSGPLASAASNLSYHQRQQRQQHDDGGNANDNSSNIFTRPPPAPQHAFAPQLEKTQEVVADISQKAAKMLQIGGKWLSKASKQVAMEVHTRIEKHRHGDTYHSDPYNNQNQHSHTAAAGGATPGYMYDWAAHLSRISPSSRAAALSSMSEDDRLTVQRILDEAALGESVAFDSSGNPSSNEGSGRGRRRDSGPPPPAYDEVVGGGAAVSNPHRSTAANTDTLTATTTATAAAPKPKPQPPPEPEADFLGMDSNISTTTTATTKPAAEVDLMGLHSDNITNTAHTTTHKTSSTSEADIAAMFSVGDTTKRTTRRPTSSSSSAAKAKAASQSAPSSLDSMIDLTAGDHDSASIDVDTSGFDALYADTAANEAGADADEPEIRKQLRQKRIQEKHDRMMRQLAEKRARDEEEEAERAGKVELRDLLKPRVDAWMAGKKDNIRALLSTLHTVLWPDSGWTPPNMSDMVDNNKVKRVYMKANLIVHPDKVKQKGGSLEQIAIADMVFDVLKGAWGKFEASCK